MFPVLAALLQSTARLQRTVHCANIVPLDFHLLAVAVRVAFYKSMSKLAASLDYGFRGGLCTAGRLPPVVCSLFARRWHARSRARAYSQKEVAGKKHCSFHELAPLAAYCYYSLRTRTGSNPSLSLPQQTHVQSANPTVITSPLFFGPPPSSPSISSIGHYDHCRLCLARANATAPNERHIPRRAHASSSQLPASSFHRSIRRRPTLAFICKPSACFMPVAVPLALSPYFEIPSHLGLYLT